MAFIIIILCMFEIKNLSVWVEEKKILHGVNMQFELGKNYCILWKNGSGKSSLAMAVMGHPSYEVLWWAVVIDGENILEIDPDERAKKGIFLAFQNIPEIKGLKLFEFLRSIYNACYDDNASFIQFKQIIDPLVEKIGLNRDFLWRDLNVGFSGGERRKVEVLQIMLLKPKYVFLDEIDSGLDVDAFKKVANLLKDLDTSETSFIVITHYFNILEYINIDEVYVLEEGKILKHWGAEIAEQVKNMGFDEL